MFSRYRVYTNVYKLLYVVIWSHSYRHHRFYTIILHILKQWMVFWIELAIWWMFTCGLIEGQASLLPSGNLTCFQDQTFLAQSSAKISGRSSSPVVGVLLNENNSLEPTLDLGETIPRSAEAWCETTCRKASYLRNITKDPQSHGWFPQWSILHLP